MDQEARRKRVDFSGYLIGWPLSLRIDFRGFRKARHSRPTRPRTTPKPFVKSACWRSARHPANEAFLGTPDARIPVVGSQNRMQWFEQDECLRKEFR